jgi:HK97 family phage prohead protease
MEHLLLKAATTATTDQGTFEAVISTPTVDREKDIVEPTAMVNALTKWATLGKLVPLAWAHTEEVVGTVDPATVRVQKGEVIVTGQVDMAGPRADETWRLVKSGTLSFSFGYLIPDGGATKRRGGGLQIKELDVFEISVVPIAPANNDTRVLSFKAISQQGMADQLRTIADELASDTPPEPETTAEQLKALTELISGQVGPTEKSVDEPGIEEPREARSADSLRQVTQRVALEVRSGGLSTQPPRVKQAPPPPKPQPELTPDELRKRSRDLMIQVLSGETHE